MQTSGSFCYGMFIIGGLISSFFTLKIFQTRGIQQFSCRQLPQSAASDHNPEDCYRHREDLDVPFSISPILAPYKPEIWKKPTVPRTSKNLEGISLPIVVVETVRTPRGKVKPHQPAEYIRYQSSCNWSSMRMT